VRYLDSSAVVSIIIDEAQVPAWDQREQACMSRLVGVETRRTLLRLRREGHLNESQFSASMDALAQIEAGAFVHAIDEVVLARASQAFPTHVKTLDAIHLSTALLLRERMFPDLSIATHDQRFGLAARSLEFEVFGAV
jgi:uncharacterized protein with PIN domain